MTAPSRLAALLLAAALGAAAVAAPQTAPAGPAGGEEVEAPPPLPPPASRADRWRFNPRERTARGLDAWEEGDLAEADAQFRRALALAPGAGDADALDPGAADPLLLLNAGTGRLYAGDPQEAAGLLAAAAQRAGETGDRALEATARYNLGSLRYAGGDYAAAAEAYREALRAVPGHDPAKHNLELALRRLAEQSQPRPGDGEGEQQPDQPGGEDGEGTGGDEGESEGEPSDQPEPGGAPQPREDAPPDPGTAPQPQPADEPGAGERRDRPLPGFEDQPDMTAEQAAAILEAVESLERQRRQTAAAERARRTAGERDW